MTSRNIAATFDISLAGDKLHVKRHFGIPEGAIDLDITFKPSKDRTLMTVLDIHIESAEIAIRHLQDLLDAARKSQAETPTHPSA